MLLKECFGPESDMFNNRRIDCCRIKRIIIEECGLVHKSLTVLTLHGNKIYLLYPWRYSRIKQFILGLILKHEWDDCDYVFTINPKQVIKDSKPSCLDDLNLDACWLEDLQILSSYLDMKVYFLCTNSFGKKDNLLFSRIKHCWKLKRMMLIIQSYES